MIKLESIVDLRGAVHYFEALAGMPSDAYDDVWKAWDVCDQTANLGLAISVNVLPETLMHPVLFSEIVELVRINHHIHIVEVTEHGTDAISPGQAALLAHRIALLGTKTGRLIALDDIEASHLFRSAEFVHSSRASILKAHWTHLPAAVHLRCRMIAEAVEDASHQQAANRAGYTLLQGRLFPQKAVESVAVA